MPSCGSCNAKRRPSRIRTRLFDPRRHVADNHHGCRGFQRVRGAQHVLNELKPAGFVQDLGIRGFHARSLAGRENDDVGVGHKWSDERRTPCEELPAQVEPGDYPGKGLTGLPTAA